MILFDTTIIVELIRGNAAYKAEADALSFHNFCISSVTKSELILGCRSKEHLMSLKKDIKKITVYNITSAIAEISNQLLEDYFLSHGLIIADSLIAATAIEYKIELYTLNKKDFRFIPGIKFYK